jgi:hypothetical protein
VLSVVTDAPPTNLVGPELVHDMVGLFGDPESGEDVRGPLELDSGDRVGAR